MNVYQCMLLTAMKLVATLTQLSRQNGSVDATHSAVGPLRHNQLFIIG
jgi:hypothetical protein